MPFGPKMPNQKRSSTSAVFFTPASCMVGTCGMAGERVRLVTASALSLPASTSDLGALHRGDRHRHMAGDDVGDRRAAALVGDVDRLHADRILEHLEIEMRDAADAGGGVVHFPLHGLRVRDQLGDRIGGNLRARRSAPTARSRRRRPHRIASADRNWTSCRDRAPGSCRAHFPRAAACGRPARTTPRGSTRYSRPRRGGFR